MSLIPPDPELNPIESALEKLAPARSRIDRDRLMFQAGVNSAKAQSPRRWVWPAIAASLAVVALSESAALAVRRGPSVLVVQQPAPVVPDQAVRPEPVQILIQAPPTQSQEQEPWLPAGSEALSIRRQVLRFGVEGLPDRPSLLSQAEGATPALGAGSETPGLLRRYELNKVLALGGPS
jgi:hypothetical protein